MVTGVVRTITLMIAFLLLEGMKHAEGAALTAEADHWSRN